MNYSKEELESIEKVKTIFADYIKKSQYIDLLWSDKLGYILIPGINVTKATIEMAPEVIQDAKQLCYMLIHEVAYDVMATKDCHSPIQYVTPSDQEQIRNAYRPYIEQLPEYSDLMDIDWVDDIE